MSGDLAGTRVFITGGGSGIGRSAALALAAEGCTVIVAGRTPSSLDDTVALVRAAGGTADAVICDVSDEESVKNAVEYAAGPTKRIDFGVNSAGVSSGDDLRPWRSTPPNSSTG